VKVFDYLLLIKLESGRPVVLPTGITAENLRLNAGAPTHVVVMMAEMGFGII